MLISFYFGQGKDCFICKKGGHRAKDCPEKELVGGSQSSKICLKCGHSEHEMFSCKNEYSPDDLKVYSSLNYHCFTPCICMYLDFTSINIVSL